MTVLVTGGAGYVGSHALKEMRAAGVECVVLDNLSRGRRELALDAPFVQGDVGDAALVRRVLREHSIDAVMHFAAYAYVGESVGQPALYYRNNVGATLVLIECMREAGVKFFVFSSTCATYGLPESIPMAEEHPQAPVNPYGASKLMVERILRDYGEAYGLRSIALRYFNAAGADPEGLIGEIHEPETHLIPVALQTAAGARERVDVYGTDYPTPDGTCIRDYIHVTDLAQAHMLALERLRAGHASDVQPRQRPGILRPRGSGYRGARDRSHDPSRRAAASRRRSSHARRQHREGATRARVEAALRKPREDHRDGLELGAAASRSRLIARLAAQRRTKILNLYRTNATAQSIARKPTDACIGP
jgi:UDP-glucose 4-epimerase